VRRDHGGGLDAAVQQHGGVRGDWLDLSTGINPVPYPVAGLTPDDWTALPDSAAMADLITAARAFWAVPEGAEVIAAPGASALIARMPGLLAGVVARGPVPVEVAGPTYNEHAAAFRAAGHKVREQEDSDAPVRVIVHPNNPDGRLWGPEAVGGRSLTVVDESFCDVMPAQSLVGCASAPGVVVLKSFGKFWGLAGLRLGFAIGPVGLTGRLAEMLGPWAVSGPAIRLGTAALRDAAWAEATRERLGRDAARLDALMAGRGARLVGGTALFRLYDVADAADWQARLARGRVWSRVFPYSRTWLRLGLPAPGRWAQLEAVL
jgi:cobalamin biosynthetic protein CobC